MNKRVFFVLDRETKKQADLYAIVLKSYQEKTWAKGLIYCDLDGWAVEEDGTLIVVDECGHVAYPPEDRFDIVWSCLLEDSHYCK